MMKDFKTYQGNAKEDVEGFVKSKSGKSKEELMAELYERAKQGKRDGTLTDKQIDDFVKKVSPMLNTQQKQKLAELVGKLKGV